MDTAPAADGKGSRRHLLAGAVTLATIVLVFAVIFPQFADYASAWSSIAAMSPAVIVALIVVTAVNLVVYVLPLQAALPTLSFRDGFVVRNTSFTISNVVPAGGAVGLAVQYRMLSSFGIAGDAATAAIGVTSLWNVLVTLGLPVLAAMGLLVVGQATASDIALAGVGLVVVAVAVWVLVQVFSSERTAHRLGDVAERWARSALRIVGRDRELGISDAVDRFRASTADVVSARWRSITVTNVALQLAQFAILYVALVGIQGGVTAAVTPMQALAAFAFARLATFIPITPGGLGTVDAGMASLLTTFGASNSDALAAVLVWRALSLFPQALLGLATFVYWRRREAGRARAAAGTS